MLKIHTFRILSPLVDHVLQRWQSSHSNVHESESIHALLTTVSGVFFIKLLQRFCVSSMLFKRTDRQLALPLLTVAIEQNNTKT